MEKATALVASGNGYKVMNYELQVKSCSETSPPGTVNNEATNKHNNCLIVISTPPVLVAFDNDQ